MTLLDTDISSGDRGDPSPNHHDTQLGNRMAHNTPSTSYTSTGKNPQLTRVRQWNNGFVIYDDTNTPRILIGRAPNDGRVGAWISKAGFSVITLLGG